MYVGTLSEIIFLSFLFTPFLYMMCLKDNR
nr:MAG TPA: hypothetical protein [Caudoviricetes sp.]